jgi:hypothetical protein
LPFGGATGAKQFYGGDKKRIVGQRRKELADMMVKKPRFMDYCLRHC